MWGLFDPAGRSTPPRLSRSKRRFHVLTIVISAVAIGEEATATLRHDRSLFMDLVGKGLAIAAAIALVAAFRSLVRDSNGE